MSHQAIAGVLIGAFLVQTVLSLRDMSAATDEAIDIAAGYSYWKTRDGRINAEHPPLVKLWLALPLLPLGLSVPTNDPSWREVHESAFAAAFLYRDLGSAERMLFRARLPIVLLAVLLAVFVRKWAAELWGAPAGLAALFLFAFEPNMIANSSLATLDLGLTAFTFISMYYVWKWLQTHRSGDGVLASVTLGLALLSKYTALAFLPLFFAAFFVGRSVAPRENAAPRARPVKAFLQLLLGAVVVVVTVYAIGFNWHPLLRAGHEHHRLAKMLARVPFLKAGMHAARIVPTGHRIWVPDVENYAEGAVAQLHHLVVGNSAFLMGRHSTHGWWYYFLVAFLIKTPLPLLLLVLMRLVLLASFPMAAGEYFLLLPITGILILSCFSTVDLGLRYVLPVYPFLFVWLSRIVALAMWGTNGLAIRGATAQKTGQP